MIGQFPNAPQKNPGDSILDRPQSLKGVISILYNKILHNDKRLFSLLKGEWETELNINLCDKLWLSILNRVHTSSACAKQSFMQCKILHRCYWTNQKLAKIFPDLNPVCNRCGIIPADHVHMFWSCSKLKPFWENIFALISSATGKTIQPCPLAALFGASDPLGLPTTVSDSIAFITLLARRIILLERKDPLPPTYMQWVHDFLYFLKLEKIKLLQQKQINMFYV